MKSIAYSNDPKSIAKKDAYGPTASGSAPLLSADGSRLITEKEEILGTLGRTL
jgi:hypothetical protein